MAPVLALYGQYRICKNSYRERKRKRENEREKGPYNIEKIRRKETLKKEI